MCKTLDHQRQGLFVEIVAHVGQAVARLAGEADAPWNAGHEWREIEEMFIRDRYMNAVEARNYGLIDEVLGDTSDIVVISKEGQISIGVDTKQLATNGAN